MNLDLMEFILEIIFLKEWSMGTYGINLDVYADVGTHWIALHVTTIEIVYFDSFIVEHVSKEVEKLIGNKNIKANKFRIQAKIRAKRLLKLEFKSSHSIKSKCLKRIVKYMLPTLENMQTYFLMCKKHTNNIGSKKVINTNKVVRQKPRCANCMSNKSRFLKQKHNKKSDWNNINTKLFIY